MKVPLDVARPEIGDRKHSRAGFTSCEAADPRLWVHMPYQPSTPYWLDAPQQDLAIQGDINLGDIELALHGET